MNLSHALEAAVRSTTAPRATLLAGLENTSEAIGVGPDGDQHLDSHSSKVAAQAARGTSSGRKHKRRVRPRRRIRRCWIHAKAAAREIR